NQELGGDGGVIAFGRKSAIAAASLRHGGAQGMSDDLVSVQILASFGSPQDRDLLRQAAGSAPVPVDIVETDDVGAARSTLGAKEIDVAFIDASTAPAHLDGFIPAARSARRKPFVILVAADAREFKGGAAADGIVAKPARIEQAQVLIQ